MCKNVKEQASYASQIVFMCGFWGSVCMIETIAAIDFLIFLS